METLPLPPSPSLEQYQKRAKDLVKAAKSKKASAVHAWATDWLRSLAKAVGARDDARMQSALDEAISAIDRRIQSKIDASRATKTDFALADAQFFIASAHGFVNWADFAKHIGQPFAGDTSGREFEAAADTVVRPKKAA